MQPSDCPTLLSSLPVCHLDLLGRALHTIHHLGMLKSYVASYFKICAYKRKLQLGYNNLYPMSLCAAFHCE